MSNKPSFCLVLVTVPSVKIGRTIARKCLAARLAACVNLIPGLESHYRWQGKMEKAGETLMVIKTRSQLLPELEKLVVKEHPYDTPEFIAIEIKTGNAKYLAWLASETQPLNHNRDRK